MSGMRLHWRSDGADVAAPLVLLGSLGSTTDMWTPILAPLVERFRVIRIDHRGHGDSPPAAPGTPATLADLAADVEATLDDIGLDRVPIAGLSLGGMVAMWLAAYRPQRVGRLAALSTSARMARPAEWSERAGTVRASGMAAIADAVAARWITPALAERDQALYGRLGAMIASIDAESYAQCCDAIAGMDLRPDLARIASPTLVVVGREDPATPIGDAELLASGITNADMEIVDDAAHVPTFEHPGRIATLLLAHFAFADAYAAGLATRRAVLGDEHVERALRDASPLTAPFQELLTRYAWGAVWSRPELSRRERSIATLVALVTLGAEHELAMHVRAARRNGLTDSEILEVLMHTAIYAGLPRANRAVAIARDVLAEQ